MSDSSRWNLVLVTRPRYRHLIADFQQIAAHCRAIDPNIRPLIHIDSPWGALRVLGAMLTPTLVFSPRRLLFYHLPRGTVRAGKLLAKSAEYRRLEAAGIAVPPWRLLTRSHAPDVSAFGRFIVTKPDYGGRGADVKIRRASRVRWSRPNTPVRFASRTAVIAQQFVFTGRWPISYRVGTLFGRVIYSWRVEASHHRKPLESLNDFSGISIVSSHPGCSFFLNDDPQIIELAERAHRAFPDIPLLGLDILREEPSGRLFVLEVNGTGDVWHFSSGIGKSIQQWAGFDLQSQFGGLRRAAEILVDATREQAR
ncbi:MAG TPA: hypothetical protein VKV03_05445 [Candidatus Binataceae bacterium]|nr:hypothetical protein [Candidatus Binataceae bacterium]